MPRLWPSLKGSGNSQSLPVFLFQYLSFLQDPAISVRDIPDSEVHDRGAQHGLHPTVSKEALAAPEDAYT